MELTLEKKAALTGLSLYLNQLNSSDNIKKVASIGLALHLNEKKSTLSVETTQKVAAVALAYHLATKDNVYQPALQISRPFSPWAFKGFVMRQIPDRGTWNRRF
jgi:hypothetical protein